MLNIFSYVSGPSVLREMSVQVLCPFFNWVVCLPGVELCEFFIYFGDQTLVWVIICKYIFLYGWFPICFAAVFFSRAEAFYFDKVPYVYSFSGHFYWDIINVYFLAVLLSLCLIHYWKWGIEVFNCCWIIFFSLQFSHFLLPVFLWSFLGAYMFITYILLMNGLFYHYKMPLLCL